jgi:pSer/pThr/pTyr-binding forkhead associated (FHA) protein
MKLSLVVITAGKMQGKSIPVTVSEFIVGRDPDCHLRPASPLISKKHCAFLSQGTRASIRDFGSTNGTLVNNEVVNGERPIANGDIVKVGPIEFRVEMEVAAPPARQTPTPRSMPTEAEDAAAALLLSVGDDENPSTNVDSQGVPTGSTIMESINLPSDKGAAPGEEAVQTPAEEKAGKDRMTAAKAQAANTSVAAKAILEKYMRRPRG